MEQPQYSARVQDQAWFINELPAGAKTLTLPENGNIRILAVTVADESRPVRPTQPLYDTLERSEQ
jgi:alpha-mannosidase